MGKRRGSAKTGEGQGMRRMMERLRQQESKTKGRDEDEGDDMYDEVDQFIMKRDKVRFGDESNGGADSEEDGHEEEAVMDLDVDEEDSDEDEEDEEQDEEEHDDFIPGHAPVRVKGQVVRDEEEESDYEGERQKIDQLSSKWGKRKRMYYDTDVVGVDIDEDEAREEEEEAIELQKKQLLDLDATDFFEDGAMSQLDGDGKEKKNKKEDSRRSKKAALLGEEDVVDLNDVGVGDEEEDIQVERVERDLSKLSKKEKLELLARENPELLGLLEELKRSWREERTGLQPSLEAAAAERLHGDVLSLFQLKDHLLLGYSANIFFYLYAKVQGTETRTHPVIERIVQLRMQLEKLTSLLRPFEKRILASRKAFQEDLEKSDDTEESSDGKEAQAHRSAIVMKEPHEEEMEDEDTDESSVADLDPAEEGEDGEMEREEDSEGDEVDEDKFMNLPTKKKSQAKKVKDFDPEVAEEEDNDHDEEEEKEARRKKRVTSTLLQETITNIEKKKRVRKEYGKGDAKSKAKMESILQNMQNDAEADEDDFFDDELDDFFGLNEGDDIGPGKKKRKTEKKEAKRKKSSSIPGVRSDEIEEAEQFLSSVLDSKKELKEKKKEQYTRTLQTSFNLQDDIGDGEKRGINYQILSNRGLTPHKNKLNRNPRKKKRVQFKKAEIRRKGQVREVRTGEASRYGGETSGIKATVVKSRKLR